MMILDHIIKINNKEYHVKNLNGELKIGTEIGWLSQDRFINYLLINERQNELIDLAEIGLDRLLKK